MVLGQLEHLSLQTSVWNFVRFAWKRLKLFNIRSKFKCQGCKSKIVALMESPHYTWNSHEKCDSLADNGSKMTDIVKFCFPKSIRGIIWSKKPSSVMVLGQIGGQVCEVKDLVEKLWTLMWKKFKISDTVLVIIKLTKFAVALRLRCGSYKLIFDIIPSLFAKFKNVVHSLEPGETPSNSASHQAPSYVQRS